MKIYTMGGSDFAGILLHDDLWKIFMKTQIRGHCDCDFAGDFHVLLFDDLWKILMKIHIRGPRDPKHYIAGDFHFYFYFGNIDNHWRMFLMIYELLSLER